MPKCPKCNKEIDSLIEFQKALTAFKAVLDNNDFEYEEEVDYPEPLAAPYWACPKCLETLFTAKNKAKAIAFLKGA